jgi:hypothetical protein
MKPLPLLCLLSAFCAAPADCQNRTPEINPNGETRLSATVGKIRIVVVLHTSTVDIGSPVDNPDFGRESKFVQCTGGRSPCVLTGQLSILVDGDEVEVPKSAFADLGDIVSVEVSRDGDNFALTIEGGDAAYSYLARLIFDKHRVLERRLYPGEFREHLAEDTRYYPGLVIP